MICKYFLRGQCRFGDNCKFEHTTEQRQEGFGSKTWTNPNRNNNANSTTNASAVKPFSIEVMTSDLTPRSDKPLWPLSSYGPAKHEPLLLEGLDESPEELRVRAFTANQAGNLAEYITYETNKIAAAEQTFTNARTNIKEAYEKAARQSAHSALFGIPAASSSVNAFGTGSAFGAPAATSAFGNASSSSFGKPAFGQSAFGQSAFGQTATPAATSAFGQPAQSTSAFGQPQQPVSAFGQLQNSQPASAFGQTSSQPATSAFGQPSAFGQAAQPAASAFGQVSQSQSSLIKPATGAFGSLASTGTTNAFGGGAGFSAFSGQPSAFGSGATNTAGGNTGSVFGQPSFGASAAPPASGSAFGTVSAFGQPQNAPTASAFGNINTNTSTSAFNTAGPTPNNSFSNTGNQVASPFAAQSTPSAPSAFGPQDPQNSLVPPLSAFPMGSPSTSSSSAFPAVNNPFTQNAPAFGSAPNPPPPQSAASAAPDFANAKSTYKPGLTAYDQQLPPNYMQLIPPAALDAFQSQKFEWGKIPDWIPPLELR